MPKQKRKSEKKIVHPLPISEKFFTKYEIQLSTPKYIYKIKCMYYNIKQVRIRQHLSSEIENN